MSSAGQTAGEMKSAKTVWPYPLRDNLLQICQALAPFIPFEIKVPVENMSGNWSFGVKTSCPRSRKDVQWKAIAEIVKRVAAVACIVSE